MKQNRSPYEAKRQQEQKKLQLWLDTDTSKDLEDALKGLGYYNISETKTNRQKWFKEIVDEAIDKAVQIREGKIEATPKAPERGTQGVLYPLWIPTVLLGLLDRAIEVMGYKTRSQWFRDQVNETIRKHKECQGCECNDFCSKSSTCLILNKKGAQ